MSDGLLLTLFMLTAAPLIAAVIRTAKARLQNRRGPSLIQPYYDLTKLFQKGSIVSPTTSWIFRVAPYIYFATALTAAVLVGVGLTGKFSDMLLLIYLFGMGRFFLALASLDAGSTFGGMGGSREMYISVLVEPTLLLALMTVAGQADATSLGDMHVAAWQAPLTLPYILSAIAFFIVMIAETGRVPVDNPDTHLELTMVHEGMVLEYSGRALALIHLASMIKQAIIIVLFSLFFIPWMPELQVPVMGWIWLAAKVLTAALLLAIAETSTNKMRLFKLPGFLAVSCLLSLLALVAQ